MNLESKNKKSVFVKGADVQWQINGASGRGRINSPEPYINNRGVEVVDVFVDADSDSVEVPVEYLILK